MTSLSFHEYEKAIAEGKCPECGGDCYSWEDLIKKTREARAM